MALWIDLKELRLSRGWLQREAAEKLGVSRFYLSQVENGKRSISINMLESIIKAFGVTYNDFHSVTGEEETK